MSLRGVLFEFNLSSLQAKFLSSPKSGIVFLSPSFLIIMKPSRVGSGTSWLSLLLQNRAQRSPAQGKAEERLPCKPRQKTWHGALNLHSC